MKSQEIVTGGRIVPRFQELDEKKLGKAGRVREVRTPTHRIASHRSPFCPVSI